MPTFLCINFERIFYGYVTYLSFYDDAENNRKEPKLGKGCRVKKIKDSFIYELENKATKGSGGCKRNGFVSKKTRIVEG